MHVFLAFPQYKGTLLNHILAQKNMFFFHFFVSNDHPKELNSLPFIKEHSIESAQLTFL